MFDGVLEERRRAAADEKQRTQFAFFGCLPMEAAECHKEAIHDASVLQPRPSRPSDFVKVRLNDPNAYSDISDWEFDFRQIGAGPLDARISARMGQAVTIMDAFFSPDFHQVGTAPPEDITLMLMVTPTMKTWRGIELDRPCLLSFGPEQEFEGVNTPGSRAINLSVPKQRLFDLADCFGLDVPQDALRSAPVWVTHNPWRLKALIQRASFFLTPPATCMTPADEKYLMMTLLLAVNDAQEQDDRSSLRIRSRAVARALDYMEDCADEPISISRICAETGVSWRTLDRAFLERFGIGPKAYQTRLRLSRARADIVDQGPDGLVSDVANKWGFWHMGKFAQDYKALFGELPSETRRRRSLLISG